MTLVVNLAASAANINASGKVNVSGINATGTPSSSTFLRGDGSWQTAGGDPTTTQVLNATAGATGGAVGTYAMLYASSASSYDIGSTLAGSSLVTGGVRLYSASNTVSFTTGSTRSGTWRCMGYSFGSNDPYGNTYRGMTMWLRIS